MANAMPASLARRSHCAAGGHLGVLQRQPAERDDEARVIDDRRPVSDLAAHRRESANDMRQKKLRRAEAVIAQLVDAAAAEEQKAPRQRAGMMHTARRRPSV
jgi:hypothetical protein